MAGLVEGRLKGILHDRADGAGATPAFRTAAEAGLNLRRRAGTVRAAMQAGTDRVVGQDVAGTDDHAEPKLALGIVPLVRMPRP